MPEVQIPHFVRDDNMTAKLLGLRTNIYKVSDLAKAKAFYKKMFGIEPYFDEPFYVGFNVGGFELGLDPDTSEQTPGAGGSVTYWGVASMDATMTELKKAGAKIHSDARDVGDRIKVASILDPFGNVVGLIENPHYKEG
jgi:predicted enzyme related to lactoylglutathione lyase